jgi:hypothetical protein
MAATGRFRQRRTGLAKPPDKVERVHLAAGIIHAPAGLHVSGFQDLRSIISFFLFEPSRFLPRAGPTSDQAIMYSVIAQLDLHFSARLKLEAASQEVLVTV